MIVRRWMCNARQVAGTVAGTLLGLLVLLGLERQAQAQDRPGDRDRQAQPRARENEDPAGPSARDEGTAGPRHVRGPEGPASPPQPPCAGKCPMCGQPLRPQAGPDGPPSDGPQFDGSQGGPGRGGWAMRPKPQREHDGRQGEFRRQSGPGGPPPRGPQFDGVHNVVLAPMVGSWVRSRHAAMTVIRVSSDGRPVPAGRLRGVRSSMDRNAIMD